MKRVHPEARSSVDRRLVDGVGLWLERLGPAGRPGRPALFLDRDGVVVEETHYLCRAKDVRMIEGAAAAIRAINEAGLPVVLVTNQAGVGHGYYDWTAFEAVQQEIVSNLARDGATINLVLACAYHEKGRGEFASPDHPWRKPQPGMFLAAAQELGIEMPGSMIVGDKISDLEGGMRAGVGRGVLVETGYGLSESSRLGEATLAPMQVGVAADIGVAVMGALSAAWPARIDRARS